MPKSKNIISRKVDIGSIILAISTFGIVSVAVIYTYSIRQAAPVFLISESAQYGVMAIPGILEKDAQGVFTLARENGSKIILSSTDIDVLVGYPVVVKGELLPPATELDSPYMVVREIESI